MRRWGRIGCVVGVLGLLVAGCRNSGGEPETVASEGRPDETTAGFPVTIQNCGRTLTFERRPSKVVTGDQSVLETLIELDLQNQVLGRTRFDEGIGAPDEFMPGHQAIYDGIPGISMDSLLPERQQLLALGADLVVDVSPSSFDAAGGHATVEELSAAGTQVFIAGTGCAPGGKEGRKNQLEHTLQDILDLGRIFGVEDRAAEMVDELRDRLEIVHRAVADEKPLRVVFVDPTEGSFATMGEGLADAVAEAAGVKNALHAAGDKDEVSAEEVARAEADAYVVIQHPPLTAEQRIAAIEKTAPNGPGVRDRRYVVVPAVAFHPGYRTFVAVEAIARALYPDDFEKLAGAGPRLSAWSGGPRQERRS